MCERMRARKRRKAEGEAIEKIKTYREHRSVASLKPLAANNKAMNLTGPGESLRPRSGGTVPQRVGSDEAGSKTKRK